VPGIAAVSSVIVHKDLDNSIVYNIAKGILENKDRIAESYPGAKRYISEEGALVGLSIPMHPGAIKYFEETNNPGLSGTLK